MLNHVQVLLLVVFQRFMCINDSFYIKDIELNGILNHRKYK